MHHSGASSPLAARDLELNADSFRPSSFYFRSALRGARTKEDAIEVGLVVIMELESLKEWVRSLGLTPPMLHVMREEAIEKNLDAEES